MVDTIIYLDEEPNKPIIQVQQNLNQIYTFLQMRWWSEFKLLREKREASHENQVSMHIQTIEYILTLIMDTQLLIPYLTNVQQTQTLNYAWLIT